MHICAILIQMNTIVVQVPHSPVIQVQINSSILVYKVTEIFFYTNYLRSQTFAKNYEVKHVLGIPEVPKEFVMCFLRYSPKRLKLKVPCNFGQ